MRTEQIRESYFLVIASFSSTNRLRSANCKTSTDRIPALQHASPVRCTACACTPTASHAPPRPLCARSRRFWIRWGRAFSPAFVIPRSLSFGTGVWDVVGLGGAVCARFFDT